LSFHEINTFVLSELKPAISIPTCLNIQKPLAAARFFFGPTSSRAQLTLSGGGKPGAKVITQLEELQPPLAEAAAKAADEAIEYYQNNQKRMKYKDGRKRHEPVGSGAIESTCRQLQCRLKRCGQFWSTQGDEALLCLEMFWRNERWKMLFPHAKLTAIANN
jgi:hypothetical protein